jgi:hypothetical protein
MKNRIRTSLTALPFLLLSIFGCSQKSTDPNNIDAETGPPVIVNLTAEKNQILYGGQDPAIITCTATGGNLKYVWQVDLGDIIPMNSTHSKISFNGAACCVGDKTITCTVSNSKGSVSKAIVITILEVINTPEIISLESDKTQINAGTNETASLVCYAIGGHLKYAWETDCGDLTLNKTDSSKVTFAATTVCAGTRNITCTVSNEKGKTSKTLQITVNK